MIKRATPFLLLILLVSLAGKYSFAQQSIQLYYEDFNGGTAGFTLNTPTSVSTGTGTNQWMINNIYDGGGLYPNTPDETQTVSGTIAGAPYSNYLHVNDVNNTAVAGNGNYDPDNASDNMAIMNTSFCTLGLTDVTFTFFISGKETAPITCRFITALMAAARGFKQGNLNTMVSHCGSMKS